MIEEAALPPDDFFVGQEIRENGIVETFKIIFKLNRKYFQHWISTFRIFILLGVRIGFASSLTRQTAYWQHKNRYKHIASSIKKFYSIFLPGYFN